MEAKTPEASAMQMLLIDAMRFISAPCQQHEPGKSEAEAR